MVGNSVGKARPPGRILGVVGAPVFVKPRSEFAQIMAGSESAPVLPAGQGVLPSSLAKLQVAREQLLEKVVQPSSQLVEAELFRRKAQEAYASLSLPEEQLSRLSAQDAARKLEYLVSDARQMQIDEKLLSEAEEMGRVAGEFARQGDYRQSMAWSRQAFLKIMQKL